MFSLPSAITSLHQNAIARINDIRLIIRLYCAKANPWKDKAADVVRLNKLIDVYKGHGEGDTKWKGCAWKLLLFKFNIVYWYKFTIRFFLKNTPEHEPVKKIPFSFGLLRFSIKLKISYSITNYIIRALHRGLHFTEIHP